MSSGFSGTQGQTQVQDGLLRRVRSTGDMPHRPNRIFIPENSRARRQNDTFTQPFPYPLQESEGESSQVLSGRSQSAPQPNPDHVSQTENQGGSSAAAAQHLGTNGSGDATRRPRPRGIRGVLAFVGLGRAATQSRRVLAAVIWSFSWASVQITVISVVLALSGTVFKSPFDSTTTEWAACDRPIGVWGCLWIARVVLGTGLAYWEYVRERNAMAAYHRAPGSSSNTSDRSNNASNPRNSPVTPIAPTRRQDGTIVPPPNPTFTRLSIFVSLITLSWFLTTHILIYTSVNTCRHTSPHLWWLVFAILCTMYLMVFEVVLAGFFILVVMPILFVFWNILLICLGRHPIQNPHFIKPDVGKIPKAVVERIPLVMYIPPPPEGSDLKPNSPKIISDPHSYPPTKSPLKSNSADKPRPRFKFIRKMRSSQPKDKKGAGSVLGAKAASSTMSADVEKSPGSQGPLTWGDYWEDAEYPFVVLEGNRAACAICLCDFEEPKRKAGLEGLVPDNSKQREQKADEDKNATLTVPGPVPAKPSAATNSSPTFGISLEERSDPDTLRLEDAGEVAQPLRLLACGHVFHKTCLDPWLIDVSGRCPVCQRAVEIPEEKGKKKRNRAQTGV